MKPPASVGQAGVVHIFSGKRMVVIAGKFWANSSPGMNLASPRLSITATQILCIMDGIIATAACSMVIAMIADGRPISS